MPFDTFITKPKNPIDNVPNVALPPQLKSFNNAHTSKSGLTPLGQVIKPEPAHYIGQQKANYKSSARPSLVKRMNIIRRKAK
jgi:hypothetical protein